MAEGMHRTNIYLSDEDRGLIEYIKETNGLRSTTSVIRFSIRRIARQLQAEERRASRPPAASPGAGGEGD